MQKKNKVVFLYTGGHPLHLEFAKSITKDIFPLSKRIPKEYKYYLVEGDYKKIVLSKLFEKIDKNSKIIILFSDPRLFYLNHNKTFDSKKNRVVYASFVKKIVSRFLLKFIDGAVCIGKFESKLFKKIAPRKPLLEVNPFIFDKKYKELTKHKPNLKSKKVLFVGNGPDYYYKGLDILIKSFLEAREEMPDLELDIIGNWDKFNKKKIPGVHFLGVKGDVERYYKNYSLYVHVARGEAFGLTVIEAMLAGLPSIVSNLTGAKECVEKVNKNFICSLNPNKISERIINYFNLDLKEKNRLSKKSQGVVKKYKEKEKIKEFQKKFEHFLYNLK